MSEPRGALLVNLLDKLLVCKSNTLRILEIGCIRSTEERYEHGDGYSTLYLSRWAAKHEAEFTSVELNRYHIAAAREILCNAGCPEPKFICGHSLDVLGAWRGSLDFAYLDGSGEQAENLEEFKLTLGIMSRPSIVAIDDCFGLPEAEIKGSLSIEYAKSKDFRVLRMDRMAVIPFGINLDALQPDQQPA